MTKILRKMLAHVILSPFYFFMLCLGIILAPFWLADKAITWATREVDAK